MKTATTITASLLLLISIACVGPSAHAQADPAWLKSWNEAQKTLPATPGSSSAIAPPDEPGIPLQIRGQVFDPDGTPAAGVLVHAYHRDSDGFDFGPGDAALSTWRLQGWAKADADGRFEFTSIRPAPDHLGREAAHIHFTLVSTAYGRQWAPTVYLADDPLVTDAQRHKSREAGKFAWVSAVANNGETQVLDLHMQLREDADF